MKKLLIVNILLLISLFYTGVHLNEEEQAFLAGLRVGGNSYDWASIAYSIWGIFCAIFSCYVAYRIKEKSAMITGGLLCLASIPLCYALYCFVSEGYYTMEDVLVFYGPYVVFSIWMSIYCLLNFKYNEKEGVDEKLV